MSNVTQLPTLYLQSEEQLAKDWYRDRGLFTPLKRDEMRQLVAERWRAEADASRARRELFEAARAAHKAGVSTSELSRVLGLSRQRIWSLLREPPREERGFRSWRR